MDTTTQKNPTLAELLNYAIDSKLATIRFAIPASIVSISEGKAEVKLHFRTVFEDGDIVDFANISNVPIWQPRSNAGNSFLSLPLKAGDYGQYIICDRSMDNWKERGGTPTVTDFRKFDINDGVFYPGLYPFDNVLTVEDENKLYLKNEDSQIELDPSGKVALKGKTGGNVVEVLEQVVELLTVLIDAKVATSIGPQPFDPATLIKLGNIKTLVDGIRG